MTGGFSVVAGKSGRWPIGGWRHCRGVLRPKGTGSGHRGKPASGLTARRTSTGRRAWALRLSARARWGRVFGVARAPRPPSSPQCLRSLFFLRASVAMLYRSARAPKYRLLVRFALQPDLLTRPCPLLAYHSVLAPSDRPSAAGTRTERTAGRGAHESIAILRYFISRIDFLGKMWNITPAGALLQHLLAYPYSPSSEIAGIGACYIMTCTVLFVVFSTTICENRELECYVLNTISAARRTEFDCVVE